MQEDAFTILVVEDTPEDFMLLQRALAKNQIKNPVQWVQDGIQAIKYLYGEGNYANRTKYPFPKVVMVDLKMPRLGGFELLEWIKGHPGLSLLPILVMSSSNLPDDISRAYALGANSFFLKPAKFEDLQKLTRIIHDYWLQCVGPGLIERSLKRPPLEQRSNTWNDSLNRG
jgi:CheY-like chemotaxis protein